MMMRRFLLVITKRCVLLISDDDTVREELEEWTVHGPGQAPLICNFIPCRQSVRNDIRKRLISVSATPGDADCWEKVRLLRP